MLARMCETSKSAWARAHASFAENRHFEALRGLPVKAAPPPEPPRGLSEPRRSVATFDSNTVCSSAVGVFELQRPPPCAHAPVSEERKGKHSTNTAALAEHRHNQLSAFAFSTRSGTVTASNMTARVAAEL